MRLRLLLLVVLAVAVPVAAALGQGTPVIRTALPCYLPGQAVRIAGAGFRAGDRYTVTLDHTRLGTGAVKPGGTIAGELSSGSLAPGAHRVLHRIIVADGALQARVGFHTSAFGASFSPAVGDPRALRVRYVVDGIGLGARPGTRVWVHYIDPSGRARRSAAIGATSGVCGSLHSIRHRLFPLAVGAGVWRLQFDLRRAYSAATQPRIVRRVAVG